MDELIEIEDRLNDTINNFLSLKVNEEFPDIVGYNDSININLLSDFNDLVLDTLLIYIDNAYEEIKFNLLVEGEYLINLPNLNCIISIYKGSTSINFNIR